MRRFADPAILIRVTSDFPVSAVRPEIDHAGVKFVPFVKFVGRALLGNDAVRAEKSATEKPSAKSRRQFSSFSVNFSDYLLRQSRRDGQPFNSVFRRAPKFPAPP